MVLVIVAALAVVACAVAIQVEQHLLRRRAERLLGDIRSLEIGKTTQQDAQRTLPQWERYRWNEGPCKGPDCASFVVEDFFYRHSDLIGRLYEKDRAAAELLFGIYMKLGGRPSRVVGGVEFRDGVVSGKSFRVHVEVPPWKGNDWHYTLVGGATSVREIWQHHVKLSHPAYAIGRPDSCDGPCVAVYAEFTANTREADVLRLMSFDLSCLTRVFRPCRTEGDIMPAAWSQYLAEGRN